MPFIARIGDCNMSCVVKPASLVRFWVSPTSCLRQNYDLFRCPRGHSLRRADPKLLSPAALLHAPFEGADPSPKTKDPLAQNNSA